MKEFILNNLNELRHSRSVLILSLIPVFASIGLSFVPLFRDFDYEFNAVLGIVVFIVSIAVTLSGNKARGNRRSEGQIDIEIGNTNLYIFKSSLIVVCVSLAASLAAVLMFSLAVGNCISARGFQFFLLLPVTSAITGCGLGYATAAMCSRYAGIAIISILVLSIGLNLLWVKYHVPIYIYSIFWGYFPGPIYDEWIPVTSALWAHRLWTLILAFLFVFFSQLWLSKPHALRKYLYLFITTFVVLFGVYEMRFKLGFDAGYNDVKAELGEEIRSGNVDMIFDRSLNKVEMDRIMLLANFYHEQITTFFELTDKRLVTLYIYKDEYQKKQLMGAGRTNFAKIFNDEIHINFEDVEGVLKHEMTHVLANDFGNAYYGTGRIGFLEGAAVASEWNENYFTPHEWAAALKKQNKLPDVVSLVEPGGFFSNAAGLSYTVSGSFTRYLIDTYGMKLFKRAYYKEAIQNVYGLTSAELSERWESFLDSIYVSDDDIKLAGVLIQPALFQKRCPHYVADILEEANTEYADGHYSAAEKAFKKALAVDTENYRILMNLIRSRYYSGSFDLAMKDIDSLLASGKINYLSRASLSLLRGDILLLLNYNDSALTQYRSITDTFANISAVFIASKMRTELIRNGSVKALQCIIRTRDMEEQKKWMEDLVKDYPENKFYRFWLTRLQFQMSKFPDVIALWKGREDAVPDTIMEFERLKMMAESHLRLSEYGSSEAYWHAAKEPARRTMDREYIEQRLALLDWLKRRSN